MPNPNNMAPSARVEQFVKSYEGCKLKAYYATADEKARGVATIGWGETSGVKIGMVWTQAEADARFDARIKEFARGVAKLCAGAETSQNEFDALCSFAYNAGLGRASIPGKGLAPSTLLKYHVAGKHVLAAAEFPKWNKQSGVVLDGLIERRARERDIYAHGIYRDHDA